MSKLFKTIKKHLPSSHGYAHYTQIYLYFRPETPVCQSEAVRIVEICITDIRTWLISQKLKFNDLKTEFLIIGTRQQLKKIEINYVRVGDVDIKPVESVRDLGAWFDEHMSMDVHVGKICSKASRSLYNNRQIRKFLSQETAKTLVHAFVTSHLDYCNSLLLGIQHGVQLFCSYARKASRDSIATPRYIFTCYLEGIILGFIYQIKYFF